MMSENHAFTAGEFRFPVSVESPVETPDGSGGVTLSWVVIIPLIWFHVEEVHGDEKYGDEATGRLRTFRRLRFTSWWRDDILATYRLNYEGTRFNIRRIDNLLGRKKFVRITADSGVEQ